MEPYSTQQEVLLITGSGFSQRPLTEKESDSKALTYKEQLEEACWNGMLEEMLPEIFARPANGHKLYLWKIREAGAFLELEWKEFPEEMDKQFSVDPYSFMPLQSFN